MQKSAVFIGLITVFSLIFNTKSHPSATRQNNIINSANNNNEMMEYLHRYGYLEDMDDMTDKKFKAAVMDFQHFIGMEPSGEMDKETMDMMHRPRCGRPDKEIIRLKRYAFFGNRTWDKPELSFSVDRYANNLQSSVVNDELQRALNVWSEYTKIRFKPSNEGRHGDINITFVQQDGQGRALGYAYKPTKGVVVLDDDEYWTRNTANGTNLFQVAVHEFGHTLGLGHSDNRQATMFPHYMGYKPNFSLHEDDIRGIKALYRQSLTLKYSQRGDNVIICQNLKIDAMFLAPDEYIYILKEDKYWKLTLLFVVVDGPKLISSRWPDVPSKIDAAFTASNNITYFFKDKYVWKYILDRKAGNSKLISVAFRGIPNELNAALVWNGNGKIYFFKGENYWMFDTQKPPNMRVKYTYPQPISRWNGLPNNLDAAVAVGRSSFFFKDGKYYRYDDMNTKIESGYPKDTVDLLGCN